MTAMVPVQQGGGLTDKQAKLVALILKGTRVEKAMRLAGYSSTSPPAVILGSPAVQAALRKGRDAVIQGDLAQLALGTMKSLITNPKTPAATRFSAAKWILERNDGSPDGDDVPLHQMTPAQLEAFMARAQSVIDEGGERPTINVTPENGA